MRSPQDGDLATISLGQIAESAHFLMQHLPSMTHVTRLDFSRLPLTFVLLAAGGLGLTAPASLTSIRLTKLQFDQPLSGLGMTPLWPVLACLRTLHSLQLTAESEDRPYGMEESFLKLNATDLAGLICLSQLRSLQIESVELKLVNLPAMPGLTQVSMMRVVLHVLSAVVCISAHEFELSLVPTTDDACAHFEGVLVELLYLSACTCRLSCSEVASVPSP